MNPRPHQKCEDGFAMLYVLLVATVICVLLGMCFQANHILQQTNRRQAEQLQSHFASRQPEALPRN